MSTERPRQMFKVQVSITSSEPVQQCLIYNRDKSIMGQFDVTPEIRDLMAGRLKIYVMGHIDEKGQVVMSSEVPEGVGERLWN